MAERSKTYEISITALGVLITAILGYGQYRLGAEVLAPRQRGLMKQAMRAYLILALASVCGCTTVGSATAENMTAVPSDKGVVVFSTSADSTSSVASIGLYLVQAATRKRYDRVVINIDYPFKSHFPSEHAHVRSLTLPAGDYYFIPYGDNAIFCLVKYPTYGFSVEAGSIAYLGAFRLSSNALTVSSYRRERDVAYFVDRNPSLRSEEIKPEALVIGDRSVDSCDADESVDGIIWNLP